MTIGATGYAVALLGAIALEAMDIIHPTLQRLIPNPENPNLPGFILKGAQNRAAQRQQAGARRPLIDYEPGR